MFFQLIVEKIINGKFLGIFVFFLEYWLFIFFFLLGKNLVKFHYNEKGGLPMFFFFFSFGGGWGYWIFFCSQCVPKDILNMFLITPHLIPFASSTLVTYIYKQTQRRQLQCTYLFMELWLIFLGWANENAHHKRKRKKMKLDGCPQLIDLSQKSFDSS
jgi:ABC-type transport system involved in multi-copper enzyme maturation permease subunit